MPDCQICFCPTGEKVYSCADPSCTTYVCNECVELYIGFSSEKSIIPKCIDNNCNSHYILSGLKDISDESIEKYEMTCLNYFSNEHGSTLQKKQMEAKILEDLRNERIKFIEVKFPTAIATIAKWAFSKKLASLDKKKRKIIDSKVSALKRQCMNTVCKGLLDEDMKCLVCATQFCSKCEKPMGSESSHTCLQADIESVSIVNGLIKCPGCHIPVFKDQGCNIMRCSSCNTNFDYVTGKAGGGGNSHNVQIVINKKPKLSLSYPEKMTDIKCFELLLKIENSEPSLVSRDTLLHPLKYLAKTGDRKSASKQAAKKFDRYMKSKYQVREYHKAMIHVEKLLTTSRPQKELEIAFIEILSKID
jgi:hypothetical protein